MSAVESAVHEILDSAADHPGSVPQWVVTRLRAALGQPEAQETREPEE